MCTGSLILAAAGLLDGKRATSHWLALEQLRGLGAEPVSERVVFDGKIVTAAGVSAGIDMALALAATIAGEEVAQAIQLGIEYDPQPPFDAGSPTRRPRRSSRGARVLAFSDRTSFAGVIGRSTVGAPLCAPRIRRLRYREATNANRTQGVRQWSHPAANSAYSPPTPARGRARCRCCWDR